MHVSSNIGIGIMHVSCHARVIKHDRKCMHVSSNMIGMMNVPSNMIGIMHLLSDMIGMMNVSSNMIGIMHVST